MSGNKLHPIYVALDSHQYNRAVKLASALPESNTLGKALLAHAYSKSGQRYPALVTLNKILGNFCELKHELENSIEAISEEQQLSKPQAQQHLQSAASKKGKKGKKKPSPATNQKSVPPKEDNESKMDLIDRLNTRPVLPESWEEFPPSENAIKDETTLATLSVTLQSLKLPLTAYQLYAWAASAMEPHETILTKTFSLGLNVLASPSKWSTESQIKIGTHVLAHMQAIALQWTRLLMTQSPGNTFPIMLATGWASQASLWQLQWLPEDEKRSMILPRLAESMARRLLEQEGEKSSSAEIRLLCLRVLEYQEKWSEMLNILDDITVLPDESASVSDFGVALTAYQVQTEKARILFQLDQFDKAKSVYEDLLKSSPDDWSCWKGHLQCCVKNDCVELTESLVETFITQQAASKYPLRGPELMKAELAAHFVRVNPSEESLQRLASSIESYGTLFASRASCAFSDLEIYIKLLLSHEMQSSKDVISSILQFAENIRKDNASPEGDAVSNNKERQSRLRAYIFAVKLNQMLLAVHVDLQDQYQVDSTELVSEWENTLSLSSSNEGEESQRELKPGDDLALLAVHQLLYKHSNDTGVKIVCAALLEKAMQFSPDNAYLKIAAIDVYHQLDATSRSWTLFQEVGLKHIQLDSCTYTIIPCLLKGGLYNETIEICNAMVRFQATTARDCGDYAGRAMDAGTLSKADEFMVFQRTKMNKSLSVMEAKGLILDAAPLLGEPIERKRHDVDRTLKGCLGLQGIVGAENDMERATQMVIEAHNPFAALSLVSWADSGGKVEDAEGIADNRDTSIFFHQILYKTSMATKESIVKDSLRRGHLHGLLIRAALCLDATKGPKKGKIVNSSAELEKRTKSLIEAVDATSKFIESYSIVEGKKGHCYQALVETSLDLCRILAVISTGMPAMEDDNLATRETRAFELLQGTALSNLKKAKENLSDTSVKDVCFLLPNFIVPVFALFRICSNLCVIYGWGKRKRKTKKCAGGVADFAIEFNLIIQECLSIIQRLPSTANSSDEEVKIPQEYLKVIDENLAKTTKGLIVQGQNRTRLRVEPILQEINETLSSFDVIND